MERTVLEQEPGFGAGTTVEASTRGRPILTAIVCALVVGGSVPVSAEPQEYGPASVSIETVAQAVSLHGEWVSTAFDGGMLDPFWTVDNLVVRPQRLRVDVGEGGFLVFDRGDANSWYSTFAGNLIRLDGNRQTVLVEGVQGIDIDVRADLGFAVSREPDFSIVLHSTRNREAKRVLLSGPQWFYPRISPDGRYVLVSESASGHGRFSVVELPSGRVNDLGLGVAATWTPNNGIVYSILGRPDQNHRFEADLYFVPKPGAEPTRLTATAGVAEVEAAVSLDGKYLAWVNAYDGSVHVQALPAVIRALESVEVKP